MKVSSETPVPQVSHDLLSSEEASVPGGLLTIAVLLVRLEVDPVDVVGALRKDSGRVFLGTTVAEAGHPYHHPVAVRHLRDQGTTTVTRTSVLAYGVGTEHVGSDVVEAFIQGLTQRVADYLQSHLLQDVALLAQVFDGSPTGDGSDTGAGHFAGQSDAEEAYLGG